MNISHLFEGLRIVKESFRKKFKGHNKFSGDVESICRSIISSCYNKEKGYFMVSTGNFSQFWSRDFGMVCKALLELGYEKEVKSTLVYSMEKFSSHGKITTQITPRGKCVDFPYYTPESASYMLNSLILLNDKKLINQYKPFFESIAKRVFEEDIDKSTGLLRKDKYFSSMKDHSKRKSSCYNNCLLALFVKNLEKIGVISPLQKYDYPELLKKYFWKDGFIDDLSGKKVFSGDANTYPYWTGIITDKAMFKESLRVVKRKELDHPWPLKYTTYDDAGKFNFADVLVPGYERDSIWMHLGVNFLEVVCRFDKKIFNQYMNKYEELIAKQKNFYEVYNASGEPFKTLLYQTDDTMIWAAVFLNLYLKKNEN